MGDNIFWEKLSSFYDFLMKKNDAAMKKAGEKTAKFISPEFSILEIACGTGNLTKYICPLCKSMIATDFSPKMTEKAKKLVSAPNLEFKTADGECLPFEPFSFDAVIIANALHIMPSPQKTLKEAKKVLKENGLLIAPTFIYQGKTPLKLRILEHFGFKTYHKWEKKDFIKFTEDNGFEILSSEIIKAYPLNECLLIAKKKGKSHLE